jgi:hypothetical protein
MRGYRGYTGYKPRKASIFKGFHTIDEQNRSELQRVTRGYNYYFDEFCNPCNPEKKSGVTGIEFKNSQYFQAISSTVTRVTPVTRQKSDFCFLANIWLLPVTRK